VDDFSNLNLLCPNRHRRIDRLEPDAHPADLLREMKADHEARSLGRREWASDVRFAAMAIEAYLESSPLPGPSTRRCSRSVGYPRSVTGQVGGTDVGTASMGAKATLGASPPRDLLREEPPT
jgi:hypothetical protein